MGNFKKIKRIKKRKINSNKIYLLEWEKTRPYNGHKKYSEFYVQLSNDILKVIQSKHDLLGGQELGIAACKKLAMMIASYFEDYINEIGIWDYFIKKNQELYGWSVPFFLTDETRKTDEIYQADVAFLVWFFIAQTNDVLLNPDLPVLLEIADDVFEFFEKEMDNAPTTNFYEEYLTIPDDIHFFELKTRLNWFALGSYLLGFEFNIELVQGIEDLKKSQPKIWEHGMASHITYGMQDDYNYRKRSSLSAISNLEWFVGIANCSEKMKKSILTLNKRVMGKFIYDDQDAKYYHFRNVHTNKQFLVNQESFVLDTKKVKPGEVAAFSLINWHGEWWLSGMFLGLGKQSATALEEIKKDVSTIPFYAYSEADQAATWKVVNEGHEFFTEFFGQPIEVFKDKSEMQIKMNDFYVFQRKKAMLKKGKELSRADIQKTRENTARMLSNINLGIGRPLAAVSVEKVGLAFTESIPDLIRNLQKKNLTPKVQKDLFYDVFIDDTHPKTARYVLENYPTHHLKMPFNYSTIDISAHTEFFFRYYSPNDFGDKVPNMRVLPEGMSVEDYKKIGSDK